LARHQAQVRGGMWGSGSMHQRCPIRRRGGSQTHRRSIGEPGQLGRKMTRMPVVYWCYTSRRTRFMIHSAGCQTLPSQQQRKQRRRMPVSTPLSEGRVGETLPAASSKDGRGSGGGNLEHARAEPGPGRGERRAESGKWIKKKSAAGLENVGASQLKKHASSPKPCVDFLATSCRAHARGPEILHR
jgi:hypothetical protein